MARDKLRPELEGICPARMKSRPVDARGYSVPYFVATIDGKPDFRVSDPEKFKQCVRFGKCWLCGEKLGTLHTFVIGPMCVVNRTTSEPPCHLDCATYAVKGCPFLNNPNTKYREANLPTDTTEPAGLPLKHNPTACALYTVRDKNWRLRRLPNGYLVQLGEPESVQFWHVGRIATRAEIVRAINVGLPRLTALAADEGHEALEELRVKLEAADFWLPVDGDASKLELPAPAPGCPYHVGAAP